MLDTEGVCRSTEWPISGSRCRLLSDTVPSAGFTSPVLSVAHAGYRRRLPEYGVAHFGIDAAGSLSDSVPSAGFTSPAPERRPCSDTEGVCRSTEWPISGSRCRLLFRYSPICRRAVGPGLIGVALGVAVSARRDIGTVGVRPACRPPSGYCLHEYRQPKDAEAAERQHCDQRPDRAAVQRSRLRSGPRSGRR